MSLRCSEWTAQWIRFSPVCQIKKDKFKSRKFAGANRNKISNKDNANKHTHQMAFSLDALMQVITGIKLEHDPIYLRKRKYHMKDGFDSLIGFNAHCLLENIN